MQWLRFCGKRRRNSLFRRIRSLFQQRKFPVPINQGIASKGSESLRDLASEIAQIAENSQIPCYFPCFQGIESFQDDDPISADRLIVDICKHRD